jgi:hypothetical protein
MATAEASPLEVVMAATSPAYKPGEPFLSRTYSFLWCGGLMQVCVSHQFGCSSYWHPRGRAIVYREISRKAALGSLQAARSMGVEIDVREYRRGPMVRKRTPAGYVMKEVTVRGEMAVTHRRYS